MKRREVGGRSAGLGLCAAEPLEARLVLAQFSWSAAEVYMLELVNRARADPAAEAARTGVDLTKDLTPGELARLVPSEPLALQDKLTLAARAHSLDMGNRSFFAHNNPDGQDPTARAVALGYTFSVGENIAAGYTSLDAAHAGWLESLGHRKNVLSLHENFNANFKYTEFGFGEYLPGAGAIAPYPSYHTQEFGYQGNSRVEYVLGVVYDDWDTNNFYTVGEGRAGVRVEVRRKNADQTVVGSYTTDAAGNFQIVVAAGTYDLVFVSLANGLTKRQTFTIADKNIKIDAKGSELTAAEAVVDQVASTSIVNGSAQADGALTAVSINTAGEPIAFWQTGETWHVVNLQKLLATPALSGQVIAYADPTDGLTYAAAPSSQGVQLFKRDGAGAWTVSNITTAASGQVITSELTAFIGTDNVVNIAGRLASGDLVLYTKTGGSWTYANLSDQLREQSLTTPLFAGGLISYVTSWNGQNIAGLDGSGRIQVVWWSPGMSKWRTDDLSAITGAGALAGGLNAYLTSWGGINLAGADAGGKLSVTWWVPSMGAAWSTSNLTDLFHGPTLARASLASYVTPWGGLNVTGLDDSGNLQVYWWSPGMQDWVVSDLTSLINPSKKATGTMRGVAAPTGTISLLSAAADGDVLRFWWKPGASWVYEDVSGVV